jgi:hypothetical protein
MSLRATTLRALYQRADKAYRRARCRPPRAYWRFESEHPVLLNLALASLYALTALRFRAPLFGVGMVAMFLWRIVSWHRDGLLRRQYDRRLRRAQHGMPDDLR